MKKLISLLFIILSFSGFAQLINSADTTGTLITASIRPNSQADDIPTIYTNEARGTVHHYQTWAELLAMKSSRLVQYQLATVADSAGKVFQYNGTEWIEFVTSEDVDLSNYVDKISDETILGTKTFDSVTVFNNRVSQTGLGRSTFFGEDAGLNDDGSDNENVGIGYQSLYYNSTGYQNVVIGHYAGRYNITGRNNVYVGNKSGTFGEGDEHNVFVGNFTGYNSGITKSVLLGGYAGFTLQGEATEGTICIGYDAGHTAVSPLNSVFIGRGSGYYTSSDYSVYIGYYSGADTKYNDNVFIGNFAGRFYSDGVTKNEYSKESVLIGSNVRASTFDDVDNQIVIGSNAISNGSNTATIGDDNITDIYLSEDAGATVHAGKYLGSLAITDTDQLTTKSYVDNSTGSVVSGLGYLRVPTMGSIGLQDSPILIDEFDNVLLDNGISAPNLLVENIVNDKDLTTKEYVDLALSGGVSTSDLQAVTDAGATTTNSITISGDSAVNISVYNNVDSTTISFVDNSLNFTDLKEGKSTSIRPTLPINSLNDNNLYLQNVTDTLAVLSDFNNYVDKTSNETILGIKTFNDVTVFNNRVSQTGLTHSTFFGLNAGLNDDLTYNYNTAFGEYALSSNVNQKYNTAVGYYAFQKSYNNSYCSVFGYNALASSTTGSSDAFGAQALESITTGDDNVGVGRLSLSKITTASFNNAFGRYSLYTISSGDGNIAFGFEAGRRILTGADMTNAENSLFIGYGTKANADSQTNQIVIGANAIGNGSNTATLGDDLVTDVYLSEDAGATVHGGKFLVNVAITDTNQLADKQYVDNAVTAGVGGYVETDPVYVAAEPNLSKLDADNTFSGYNYFSLGADVTYIYSEYAEIDTLMVTDDASFFANLDLEGTLTTDKRIVQQNLGGNTLIGFNSGLNDDLNSNANLAVGDYSLMSNVNSSNNVAIGPYTLYYSTEGYNTAVGFKSLYNITSGILNTTIGREAGNLLNSGATNTYSNESLYIGADTRSLSDTTTNEIVIGTKTLGNGSYSVTLGSDVIENTYLKGVVHTNVPIVENDQLTDKSYVDGVVAGSLFTNADETDPVYSAWDKSTGIAITESQITDLQNYLTSYTETDPVYAAWDKSTGISITESQISDFGSYEPSFSKNTAFNKNFGTAVGTVAEGNDSRILNGQAAYDWGDHSLAGYLTSYTETDPVYSAWDKSTGIIITESQISDLQHFTNADETDSIYLNSEASKIDSTDIVNLGNLSGINTGDQDLSDYASLSQPNVFTGTQEYQGDMNMVQSYLTRTSVDGYMKVFQPRGLPKFNLSSSTGYLKIGLPDLAGANILTLQFELSIAYWNLSEPPKKYFISSAYSDGWDISKATVISGGSYDTDYNAVYFGNDGTNPCIWIGSATTEWSYAAITINEVTVSGVSYDGLVDNDWVIDFPTTLGTVENTVDGNLFVRDAGMKIDYPYYADAGIAEIDFSLNRGPVRNMDIISDTITFSVISIPSGVSRVITTKIDHADVNGDAVFIFPTDWGWTGAMPTGIVGDQRAILTLQNFSTAQTDVIASYVLIND